MIREHLAKRGHQTVRPTARMVQRWWRELNAEVFNRTLLAPLSVAVASDREAYAWCVDAGGGRCSIRFDSAPMTRTFFLAILAHEMVHALQLQSAQEMDHASGFIAWAAVIHDRCGLTVSEFQ